MTRSDVLVTATDLAAALSSIDPPVVLDVRWRLGEDPALGQQRYRDAHVPGAAYLDLEQVLTRHTGDPRDGRHPLPEIDQLARGLAAAGVDGTREIVVYDEAGSFAAGRAWWVLSWAGLATTVLDGGIGAWTAAGLPTEAGDHDVTPVAIPTLRPGSLPTTDADGAATAGADPDTVLVDVRAPERYRGETEPLDPVAGHIPGAINSPVSGLFATDGTLPDEATLRERLAPALEGRPVVAYCGSGISAAQAVLALRTLGVDATLFSGSWSAWSNDPSRPVATDEVRGPQGP